MDVTALNFTGKTVWVTGAYQGIGREIACSFVKLGAAVVGFDKKFVRRGPCDGFFAVPLDVGHESQVDQAVGSLLQENPRLDCLVNAAGVLHLGTIDVLTSSQWQNSFDVNVTGVFQILRRLVPTFKVQRHGTIVTIASNAAHVPRTQMTAYCASKAALVALNRCVGLDLAPYGVRCNLISPGSTDTPMQRSLWQSDFDAAKVIAGTPDDFRLGIPLKKLATPADIANLTVFLASDLAGHITLQDVVIDGGSTLGA